MDLADLSFSRPYSAHRTGGPSGAANGGAELVQVPFLTKKLSRFAVPGDATRMFPTTATLNCCNVAEAPIAVLAGPTVPRRVRRKPEPLQPKAAGRERQLLLVAGEVDGEQILGRLARPLEGLDKGVHDAATGEVAGLLSYQDRPIVLAGL